MNVGQIYPYPHDPLWPYPYQTPPWRPLPHYDPIREAIQRENRRLREENDRLRRENASLRRQDFIKLPLPSSW